MRHLIAFIIFIAMCLLADKLYSQPKQDTIRYNQFRDYVEWQREHWKNKIEKETNEQYQMIYIDRVIFDKKNKKIYLYSSYDLVSGDEHGLGINLYIKPKKKKHKH